MIDTPTVLRFPAIEGKSQEQSDRDAALLRKLRTLEQARPGARAVLETLVDDYLADAMRSGADDE